MTSEVKAIFSWVVYHLLQYSNGTLGASLVDPELGVFRQIVVVLDPLVQYGKDSSCLGDPDVNIGIKGQRA